VELGEIELSQPAREGEPFSLESLEGADAPVWHTIYDSTAGPQGAVARQRIVEGAQFFRFRFAAPTP
jgi:hypothetical protein